MSAGKKIKAGREVLKKAIKDANKRIESDGSIEKEVKYRITGEGEQTVGEKLGLTDGYNIEVTLVDRETEEDIETLGHSLKQIFGRGDYEHKYKSYLHKSLERHLDGELSLQEDFRIVRPSSHVIVDAEKIGRKL